MAENSYLDNSNYRMPLALISEDIQLDGVDRSDRVAVVSADEEKLIHVQLLTERNWFLRILAWYSTSFIIFFFQGSFLGVKF